MWNPSHLLPVSHSHHPVPWLSTLISNISTYWQACVESFNRILSMKVTLIELVQFYQTEGLILYLVVACWSELFAIVIWEGALEHKADVIGCLIEVRSLFALCHVDTTPLSWPLHEPTGVRKLRTEVSGQCGSVPGQGGGGDERKNGVVMTGELMTLRKKGCGDHEQAVSLLWRLQRDNVLKWGMDLKSKWVDLKPLGRYPPCSCVCDCIHPHDDWQPLSLSNNGLVIFPRHWKTPLSTGWRTLLLVWGWKCVQKCDA